MNKPTTNRANSNQSYQHNSRNKKMAIKILKMDKTKPLTKSKYINKFMALGLIILALISLPKIALAQLFADTEPQNVSGVSNASVKLPNTEYTESTVDLRVKVLGGEVKLNRTWVNGRWYINPAWANLRFITDPLDDSVKTIDRAGTLYQRTGNADLYSFNQVYIKKIDTGWRWYDRQGNWIIYDNDGRITEYGDRNNIKVSFVLDNEGRRTAIKDHHGELVYSFIYDSNERLIQVQDKIGRTISYQWTDNKLTKVIDVLGNEWLYGYDGNGQLNQKTEPDGGMIRIDYSDSAPAPETAMNSAKNKLQVEASSVVSTSAKDKDTKIARVGKITDKTGAVTIYNTQYSRTNKQYSITINDSVGKKTNLVFDANGKRLSTAINDSTREVLKRDTANKQVKLIDERGLETTVQLDDRLNVSKITRPDGLSESFQYNDTYGVVTQYTNAQGTITNLQYDAKGNLIKSIEAVGKSEQRTASWIYDSYGQPTTVVIGEGDKAITLQQTFDENGNVTSFTDGNGNTYQFTYDIQGQVTSVKNPLNNTWTTEYNLAGYPTQTTDPLSYTTLYTTDYAGRITKVIDPLGNETNYTYQIDSNGWKIEQTNPLNQTFTYYYDTVGKPVKVVSPSGLEAQQSYDSEGRLTNQTDPAGNNVSVEYGQQGTSLSGLVVKALYPTYSESYKYNSLGLPTVISQLLDASNNLTTSISYNEIGLPISVTRPNNSVSLIEYNSFGQVTKLTDALGGETTQTWDSLGQVTSLTDAKGNTYLFSYDNNGNLVSETKALGNIVEYTYDSANQLIEQKDASNNIITYQYDAAGRKVREIYAKLGEDTPSQTVDYHYNDANQVVKVIQSGDTNSEFEYTLDSLGRTVKETISYGIGSNKITKELQYSYDIDDNLASITYPDNTTAHYSYVNGQLKEVLLANGEKITWQQYQWQMPTQINFPGATQTFTYDALQRPLTIRVKDTNNNLLMNRAYSYDKVGNVTQLDSEHGLSLYGYDLLDRLTLVTPSKLSQQKGLPVESYSYDAIDNRIGSSHQTGEWQYNSNNQLTKWGEGDKQNILTYTTNGNLATETNSEQTITYIYNTVDRLTSIEKGDREIVSYQYDPFGRRISKIVNGATTYYIYTDEGLIAELEETGSVKVAYGWQPNTVWGTSPLWQANIIANQTLANTNYNYLYTDHLGTPQLALNSRGQQTWKGVSEAFGRTQLDTTNQITMNLRFPGQYYDQEIGLHYNGFRNYNPNTGRYIQADPIGLRGGINTFTYTYNNPINYIDPQGQVVWFVPIIGGMVVGYIIDLGLEKIKEVHCDNCTSIDLVPSGGTASGLIHGIFGGSIKKDRVGLGGYGKHDHTSVFSRSLHNGILRNNISSINKRKLLRHIGRKLPWVSVFLLGYEINNIIKCR
ncbi:RHS repeat protein [Entomomonas asaccharolytica]|uniref:RHS repeat protein n=1 Tax=Entomomonas asaccharolytica TaxID=2785331 RepID=A0A974NDX1_9GAMM|nr:RHS repeat protein [Entomomonas asaccharolytica]QQP84809.1 RHS repeat protein [Entomomonas asaccharolytica]